MLIGLNLTHKWAKVDQTQTPIEAHMMYSRLILENYRVNSEKLENLDENLEIVIFRVKS